MADALFEVGDLLEARGRKGEREYLVRWKGYSAAHDSWEPAAGMRKACPDLCLALDEEGDAEASSQATPHKRRKSEPSTQTKQPKSAAPDAGQPTATAAPTVATGKSEYELERERTIQRNLEMLRQLGLLDAKSSLDDACRKPVAERAPRKQQTLHTGPRRTSNRQTGAKADSADGVAENPNEDWRPTYTSRTFYCSDGRDYGHDRTEAEWNLPTARDANGNALQRRRSCHICTQVSSTHHDHPRRLAASVCTGRTKYCDTFPALAVRCLVAWRLQHPAWLLVLSTALVQSLPHEYLRRERRGRRILDRGSHPRHQRQRHVAMLQVHWDLCLPGTGVETVASDRPP